MHAARSSVALSSRIVACTPEFATDREASEIDGPCWRRARCCCMHEREFGAQARGTYTYRVRYLAQGAKRTRPLPNSPGTSFGHERNLLEPAQTPSRAVIAQSPLEFSQHDSIDRTEAHHKTQFPQRCGDATTLLGSFQTTQTAGRAPRVPAQHLCQNKQRLRSHS